MNSEYKRIRIKLKLKLNDNIIIFKTNRQFIIPQIQALLLIYLDKNSIVAHALII
jgi:hypothetical protein